MLELRVERHGDSPTERQAQVHLRYRQKALDERVAHRQKPAEHREQQRGLVELKRQRQGGNRQAGEQHQSLERRYAPRGQGPILGSRHMRIEAAVGVVIDGAAGGSHEHGSDDEDDEDVWIRFTAAGDPKRPQGRPEQQPDPDGTIQAHETGIFPEAAADARQLVSGPWMKTYPISEPSPAFGDPLDQFNPGARQSHAFDLKHGSWREGKAPGSTAGRCATRLVSDVPRDRRA
jgi:hypothetical protein